MTRLQTTTSSRRSFSSRFSNRPTYPRVSIIIATYNASRALPITLQSVAEQSYRNRELLIIDGGSTDGTLDVVQQGNYPIDFWCSEADDGIYDAFNKGIQHASGDWIYFLGAGDRFVDADVLKQVFSVPHAGQMLYGDVRLQRKQRRYGGEFSKLSLCLRNICQQGIFYSRELFDRIGPFEPRYRVWADWAFNLQCFADPQTQPEYLDAEIAIYDEDGFSSSRLDAEFARDAQTLIRPLGRLPWRVYQLKQVARRVLGKPRIA